MRTLVTRLGGLCLVVLVLVSPLLYGQSSYQIGQLDYILCLMLVSVSLNLATGYAGQLTLGPSATFGAGAYAAALFAEHFPSQASMVVLCVIGVLAGLVVGLIAGLPGLRVGGFYLAIVTLFIALVLPDVLSSMQATGAHQGISLFDQLDFIQSPDGTTLYEVLAVLVLLAVGATWALIHSRLGRKFVALNSSEELAYALGVSGYSTKLIACLVSAVPAGLGGALYVYSQQFVTPGSIDPNLSLYLIAACIVGGMGTVWGPVIGSALIFGVQLNTGSIGKYQDIIYAALLIVFSVLFSGGIVGLARQLLYKLVPRTRHGLSEVDRRPLPGTERRKSASPRELRVSGVTVRFGGVVALDDVGLAARPGTVQALIGSNGSGKTTLLNVISGYLKVHGGQVTLGGQRIDDLGPTRVARSGVARTFQTPKLMERSPLIENVMVAAEPGLATTSIESMLRLPRGIRADREARAIAASCLADLDLAESADLPAVLIPHGMRRTAEVARCMASGADFVLLDEPAAGLSAREKDVLAAAIRRMAESGIGVLLVEHDTRFVFATADSVTVLHRGRVIADGPPEQIQTHPAVVQAYLGDSEEETAAPVAAEDSARLV